MTPSMLLLEISPKFEEDLLCALRFLHHVKKAPLHPKYEEVEAEFLNRPEIDDSPLMNPASDKTEDYSERARALAFYFSMLEWEVATKRP